MTSGSSELADLIAAAARGDRAAFRRLYEATAPKLLGIVLRIVRSRAEAEEVLQDTYVRVWKNAARFTPEAGTPMAWLVSIARNRAIDVVRLKTPITLSPDEDGTDWMERIASERDEAGEAATRDALRRCLGSVEPRTREMIVRAYCNGESREELAARYARPVNTVKTLLHRGLAALKQCLEVRT